MAITSTAISMERIVKHTPFITFLFIGLLLTRSSLFFPQNLGSSKTVAGWPLTMFVQEYKRVGSISSDGEIMHEIVPTNTQLFLERALLNIMIWTFILFITWWTYRTVELKKFSIKGSKKKH